MAFFAVYLGILVACLFIYGIKYVDTGTLLCVSIAENWSFLIVCGFNGSGTEIGSGAVEDGCDHVRCYFLLCKERQKLD
jgi:hypothetical protein